jgi:hypothetical protein
MASRKELKKDIDFLLGKVAADCCTYMYLNPEKNTDKVIGIVNHISEVRQVLISRVNKAGKLNGKKEINAHYKKVCADLVKEVDQAFQDLSSLVKSK